MSVSVCLSVCVSACFSVHGHIFRTACPIFTKVFVRVTYGRGSFLLWRHSDTLCVSGFMDDVIFAHKPRLLDEAQYTHTLGLGKKLCAVIPIASQRTHGTTFRTLKVTSQVATAGAESAVYGRLVFSCVAWRGGASLRVLS